MSAKSRKAVPHDAYDENVDVTHWVTDISRTKDRCGGCLDGDMIWDYWLTSLSPCWAGFQYRCQTPSAGLDCKMFGGKAVGAYTARALRPYVKDKDTKQRDRNIICTYNTKQLSGDQNALREWMQFRGAPGGWDNGIMAGFCTGDEIHPEMNCPDLKGPCPNFMTKSLCREWADSAEGRRAADAAMVDWCKAHPGSPICACIDRSSNDAYKKVQNLFPFSDACWYLPCKDREMIHTISQYDMRHPDSCPTTVCEQIINIVDSDHIDISDLVMQMDCGADPSQPSSEELQKILILGASAAVGVLGVGMIAFGLLS